MGDRETFLTKAQIRVLELRARGLTQAEVARKLKTSRANVCILERRGRENIERARRTLQFATKLHALAVMELKPGDDLLQAPKQLFAKADAIKVEVKLDTPELIARIRERASDKLHGRTITERIELVLTAGGDVLVY
jgi:hypothetical protein